jgi:two-component system, NtrC family, sensor histidine kinase GlrK
MRLASKIFLTSALVVVVLAGVGVLSLRAVGRLASVNREITTRTVPALRLASSTRDAMPTLVRLEARFLVLQDPRFISAWNERADRLRSSLDRLREYATGPTESRLLDEATESFERYCGTVGQIQSLLERGQRTRALALSDGAGRSLADRVEANLEALTEWMHADVLRAQAEVARLEARTWSGVLVALGAAVGLALLGSGIIAHRLTQSLGSLSAATAAVAAGSFEKPIAAESRDEVGQLARSFNAMARELRRMEETKEEFFASVSHELRSPLTSIREGAHLLREKISGPLNDKQRRLVEIIAAGSDRLLGLVNQILEVSRLRAGVLPINRVRLDLDRVITRAVEELRPTADQTGVTLERERLGDDFWITGDEDRLLQMVVNLVGNAIRFTKRGGRVVARLVSTGPELEIQVEDTGIGIPVGELPHVFEPYRQAHADRGGTGLGLAIVRGIAQAHGGRVTVESQEGKGSRFTVLLPRA